MATILRSREARVILNNKPLTEDLLDIGFNMTTETDNKDALADDIEQLNIQKRDNNLTLETYLTPDTLALNNHLIENEDPFPVVIFPAGWNKINNPAIVLNAIAADTTGSAANAQNQNLNISLQNADNLYYIAEIGNTETQDLLEGVGFPQAIEEFADQTELLTATTGINGAHKGTLIIKIDNIQHNRRDLDADDIIGLSIQTGTTPSSTTEIIHPDLDFRDTSPKYFTINGTFSSIIKLVLYSNDEWEAPQDELSFNIHHVIMGKEQSLTSK